MPEEVKAAEMDEMFTFIGDNAMVRKRLNTSRQRRTCEIYYNVSARRGDKDIQPFHDEYI
jgi:hypothetical protein